MNALKSVETRLLLACLRTQEEVFPSNQSVETPVDWSALLAQAEALGVIGLLHNQLKTPRFSAKVPGEILAQSKRRFYLNQVQNTKLYIRLKEVLQTFAQSGIEMIVLKGAALAALTYQQKGLRPMGDVDLLVRTKTLDTAENLLLGLKFRPYEERHTKEWYRAYHHHIVPYFSGDRSLAVELHHHIVPSDLPVMIPLDQLWERSCSVQIAGISCRVLSPEDFLLHLSLHVAGDGFVGKIRVLVDIAEIINQHEADIDWHSLVSRAAEYRVSKYLYYSFRMARDMVRANIPEEILFDLSRHTSRIPFVDRMLKFFIRNALIIHEGGKHPWYLWILSNTSADLLSEEPKVEKIVNIVHRTRRKYHRYSRHRAHEEGYSPGMYSVLGYPIYLLSKALGLQTFLRGGDKKSS